MSVTATISTNAQTLPVPARMPDGELVTLLVDVAELRRLAGALAPTTPEEEKPVEGYEALKAALAERNVNMGVSTLKAMKNRGRLTCRKFGKRVRFYVSEVMERIGGRA
jgi:hypothetical protein